MVDPVVSFVLRFGLALLLSVSALHKSRDRAAFRAALEAYELLPRAWSSAVSVLLPALELAIAVALLATPRGGFVAATVFAAYAGAMGINLARGNRDLDCGCAGPAGRLPISGALVVRNLILVGLALLAAAPLAVRPLVWIDAVSIAAGVAATALLYAGIETALANTARLPSPAQWGRVREGAV